MKASWLKLCWITGRHGNASHNDTYYVVGTRTNSQHQMTVQWELRGTCKWCGRLIGQDARRRWNLVD